MKTIFTENAPAAVGPYSQAMAVNGLIYTSGQLPIVPETMAFVSDDVEDQAEQCLKNVDAILAQAGCSKDNVVKTLVFLANMDDFAVVNKVYAAYFGDHKPARSCVEVARLPMGAKVEIEVIAEAQ